jgi:serine/threonine-protein kinase
MIGRTISHYRIEAELGRGGMGVVYRAFDEKLRRDVALKLLSSEIFSRSERRTRLFAEARAAAALNHPGIAVIYEVGEEGDQLFIVMELVTGSTLRSLVARGPLGARGLAHLGAQLAEALDAAHSRGVIHGDLKPDNILLLPGDRVKLLDFGVARQAAENTLTLTRSVAHTPALGSPGAGTLAYMAPEQLRGDSADARADLYSLGVVLYELAAGHRPFPGPSASMLMSQVLHDTPPTLDTAAINLPSELGRIILKLLEKEPNSRYQSARELQVDLNNFLRDLDRGPALPAAVAGKRSVAVLPFKLLTPSPEDEYLSVALADAVINHLGATGELLVRPTSTVMRYSNQTADPLAVARELNVQTIVEGSIQKLGSKLRVHAQGWNAADGSTLPSVRQEADFSELFALQDRTSEAVAVALGLRTAAAEQPTPVPPTKNSIAYELYLRAAERLSRLNKWDMRSAIEMLEEATQRDPRFSAAWARLADAYVMLSVTIEPSPRWLPKAEQAVRRALALEPNNAEAQSARGRILWTPARKFKNRLALSALEKALRINPGLHQARLWQCLILLHIGLFQEAEEGLAIAYAAHPEDAFTLTFIGQSALWTNNYDRAIEFSERALRVDPAHLWANVFFPCHMIYAGKLEEAEAQIRTARKFLPGDPWLTSCEALLWARRGGMRRASQTVSLALRSNKVTMLHTHHMWHTAAATYSLLGKPAAALRLLRRAAALGMPNYPMYRDDPNLQAMNSHAPYRKWLAGLRREWESYRRDYGKPSAEPSS